MRRILLVLALKDAAMPVAARLEAMNPLVKGDSAASGIPAALLRWNVRKRQPGCLVSGRIGNGLGDYETPGDNQIADKTETGKLYETVGTMNDSWGYRPTDTHYKSVKEILDIKAKCASIGSNYMLNVGPDSLGRFPVAAIDILNGLAKR